MDTQQRREKIMETLCQRRHDTMQHLAQEFHVTSRTIRNDVAYLSFHYPLETICGRYGGGVHVMDGFYLHRSFFTPRQRKALQRAVEVLTGEDREEIQNLLSSTAL